MADDPFSPIAPARIRVLLLPVGRIKRSRFDLFSTLLRRESIIRLGDVSPDGGPNRTMFSPLAFPPGMVLYELSTVLPPASHLALAPFELFRQPMVIIGIADGREYGFLHSSTSQNRTMDPTERANVSSGEESSGDLKDGMDQLRERFPGAITHSLMVFDASISSPPSWLPQEVIVIPPIADLKTTTIKTVMCDVTSSLLAEMTGYAKSLQALPTIASPVVLQNYQQTDEKDAWSREQTPNLTRRNSQVMSGSRSSSPPGDHQSNPFRMSMPAQLPSSLSEPANLMGRSRPTSPAAGSRTPPTTSSFRESLGRPPTSGSTVGNPIARLNGTNSSRDPSQDRISVQGFGSGSVSERARNIGKSRIGIAIGSMYLQAGRWQDALRELVDNTARSRSLSDHTWHAKGLENILVCLLLQAWIGLDFQIPSICYPLSEKSVSLKLPQPVSQDGTDNGAASAAAGRQPGAGTVKELTILLPDLVNMILAIYARASHLGAEAVPQLCFSECAIRLSKLLALVNVFGGALSQEALQVIVRRNAPVDPANPSLARPTISPSKAEIASLVLRAVPHSSEATNVSAVDHTFILAGVASVLSMLGLHRKKAIIMKELIAATVPALVQARKLGAAEAGVHPAAGLAALTAANGVPGSGSEGKDESQLVSGLDTFLNVFGRVYGIPTVQSSKRKSGNVAPGAAGLDNDNVRAGDVVVKRVLQGFGSLNVKLDVLRMCINLCEALPDFQGVLHFTALLLGVAGPGVVHEPSSMSSFVSLAKEEQIRLATNINRTVGAAKQLGLDNILTEYWDDFLVRDIDLVDIPQPRLLTERRVIATDKVSIDGKKGTKSPFIHDASVKQSEAGPPARVLVAGDRFEFIVTLQNPYEFEVEIESLRLASEGVDLDSAAFNLLLGPYRKQQFSIIAIPQAAGEVSIKGCFIKIKGCYERMFSVFGSTPSPDYDLKVKTIGLNGTFVESPLLPNANEAPGPISPHQSRLKIIAKQPLMVITDVSLPESAIMVLEGETKSVQITLQNVSEGCQVDFLDVSIEDSVSAALRNAMGKKDLPRAELYEIELLMSRGSPLKLRRPADLPELDVEPGRCVVFEIEVMGVPGLTEGLIQFNYACIGSSQENRNEKFYTRQVSVPISVTVNSSVQLQRNELTAFPRDFSWSNQHRRRAFHGNDGNGDSKSPSMLSNGAGQPQSGRLDLCEYLDAEKSDGEHYLLVLDLRNSWPAPLHVSILTHTADGRDSNSSESKGGDAAYAVKELIHPGHVSRVVLVLPKVYIPNPHAPIPSLNPANRRQFVLSAGKTSTTAEKASREAFWHREELLKRLRGSWKEEGSGRHGDIELRGIRLTPRMVQTMSLAALSIEMEVLHDPDEEPESVLQTGRSRFQVRVDSSFTLKTRLHNRSDASIHPLLRLQPSLARQPHDVALDLDRWLLWTGLLQRALPVVKPGESIEARLGLCALCSGEFEVGATVEEVQARRQGDGEGASEGRGRAESSWQRDQLGDGERRVWHASEACAITAVRTGELRSIGRSFEQRRMQLMRFSSSLGHGSTWTAHAHFPI